MGLQILPLDRYSADRCDQCPALLIFLPLFCAENDSNPRISKKKNPKQQDGNVNQNGGKKEEEKNQNRDGILCGLSHQITGIPKDGGGFITKKRWGEKMTDEMSNDHFS